MVAKKNMRKRPKRGRRAKPGFRRRFNRRKPNRAVVTNPFKHISSLPPRFMTKVFLEYNGYVNITTNTVSMVSFAIKGSSINVPFNNAIFNNNLLLQSNSTSWSYLTANPYGLTRFLGPASTSNAPYNSSRVYASKIVVQLIQDSQTDTCNCTIFPADSASYTKNRMETQYIYNAPMRAGPKQMSSLNISNSAFLTNYCTTARALGLHPQTVTSSPNQAATATADPASFFYWIILLDKQSAGNFQSYIDLRIRMTYWVELFGLNELNQSVT